MAIEMARQGWRVVFVTPSTGHDAVLVSAQGPDGIIVTPHGTEAIEAAESPVYLALSTDTSLTQADVDHVMSSGGTMIYDYIDHMDDAVSGQPIPAERFKLHDRLLADEENVLVLASADALLRDVASRRQRNMLLVTNGVDVERFKGVPRAQAGLRADFARIIARGRPILGYYGSFASWFDYDLVRRLAGARPGYDIVLIGPDLDGTGSALSDPPENLFVLPAMRYEELPRHATWFDVCLVPFLINKITLATSPLKIFEYMALGRPTVSTDLPECRKYRSILTADATGFADACDRALLLNDNAAFRGIARQECNANSWARKVAEIE
ncbi:glycosyltransferase [Rhodopseudomonas parapalustris]